MGKHIFLTGENAEEVIASSIVELVKHHRQLSRSDAFEDCTNYWKSEIEKIVKDGGPSQFQLTKILDLLNVER